MGRYHSLWAIISHYQGRFVQILPFKCFAQRYLLSLLVILGGEGQSEKMGQHRWAWHDFISDLFDICARISF